MIPARHLISPEAMRRYDDNGDPVYTVGERLLLALRWWDWVSIETVLDGLGVEDDAERNHYRVSLHYWIRAGRIERRGERGSYEYRLLAVRRAARGPGPLRYRRAA